MLPFSVGMEMKSSVCLGLEDMQPLYEDLRGIHDPFELLAPQ